ncbi:hypothetical protein PCANC_09409 [Puccinia coronata f. sp. avenae]|uniref:Uncharacterized protein n=1 Tax=Puccinia coronata f. sp. avenae TaxID=200324 RepID=A0A2N5VDE6_9BASI|nr:hypothetical protein PCANC_19675 [Puccinia coronata f. sp. avenae]PLW30087.1 hypothetical protein PCANC_23934 [Puccinia coronata f. sp. avenae]PLW41202.1 hypothetical protein PCASD_10123 [Puccinia coronata f. sp. avenae]PLW48007.1 hypothetical protein PCANC_09409 [Puccinia coronata f. sp. avenae]
MSNHPCQKLGICSPRLKLRLQVRRFTLQVAPRQLTQVTVNSSQNEREFDKLEVTGTAIEGPMSSWSAHQGRQLVSKARRPPAEMRIIGVSSDVARVQDHREMSSPSSYRFM